MADRQNNASTTTRTVWSAYDEEGRYWSPDSQTYASGDVLLTYLQSGWQAHRVKVRTFYHGQSRSVRVYYFTLRRQNESVEMPVLDNPRVVRLIEELGLLQ